MRNIALLLLAFYVTCFVALPSFSFAQANLYLSEPSAKTGIVSGNMQHGSVGDRLANKLVFLVSDSLGKPVSHAKIYLDLLYSPESDHPSVHGFSQKLLYSDSAGLASVDYTLGMKAGEYAVLAKLEPTTEHNRQQFTVYRFYARESRWAFDMALGLFGGLALFLFGISLMSDGLKKTAGDKMRTILSQLTNNRFVGVGLGTIGTIIIPSSSAISVMLVSFVNAGLMKFRQTLPVVLGAAIGTTIIAQLIAFNLSDYSMLFIAIGALLFLFADNENLKNTGEGLLGFGILFYGMDIMSDAMNPLRTYQPFISMILQLENPILGVLLGTVLTALIQSSSAFIGIVMILASQGLVSLELSMAFVLGANLGTPITALLACIKTTREAQKVAVAQFIYKLILVLIFAWVIPPVADAVRSFSPDSPEGLIATTANLPRQIANSHTLYNVILTLIALPLIKQYAFFINRLFVSSDTEQKPTKYINDSILDTPALALDLARKEISRLWKALLIVHEASIGAFRANDAKKLEILEAQRDKFKTIRDEVSRYLFRLLQQNGSSATTAEIYKTLHVLSELSHVNEVLTKTLHRRAEKWIQRKYSFSEESETNIIEYHSFTSKMLNRSLAIFNKLDTEKALRMDTNYQEAKELAVELEHAHFERMVANPQELEKGKTYLDLIYTYKTVTEHCRNIAKVLLNEEMEIEE